MNLKREWPVFALLAVIGACQLAFAYWQATYKFHPNYKNYDVIYIPSKESGRAQGS